MSDEHQFQTIAGVLEHLQECGWNVSRTSLYRHQGEGKLLPSADGKFSGRDVEKYAKAWLRQRSTGKKIRERTDELQRRKLERELQTLDLEYERKKLAHEKEQGKYISREEAEIDLAGRAAVLDAGLKHWVQSRAAEYVRLVGGDVRKTGELINLMGVDLDEHINVYAQAKEFEVVIGEEEDAGADDIPVHPEE
jgi:hypothetical protein